MSGWMDGSEHLTLTTNLISVLILTQKNHKTDVFLMMVASNQKTLVSNVWFSGCLFWRRKIFQWRTNTTFVQLVQVWLLPHSGPPCCNGLILPHEAGWRKAPAATVNENTRSREVGFVFSLMGHNAQQWAHLILKQKVATQCCDTNGKFQYHQKCLSSILFFVHNLWTFLLVLQVIVELKQ